MNNFYQKYLLPGLVFQGVVIGGGYATGRELVEFFLPYGPVSGLLAMGAAALIWSLVMAVSFELCRMSRSYDYKSFFLQLLGRFWFLYEFLLLALMIVVLSVIGAAAGEIVQNLFSIPALAGTALLLFVVGGLTFFGSQLIERFMGGWSLLLYLCYFSLVILCFMTFGDAIKASYSAATLTSGWAIGGLQYAGYNLATVPAVFFCLTHLTKRRDALTSGMLAGGIGMLPAVFLFVAMMGHYPDIGSEAIPSTWLLSQIGLPWFSVIFQVVLLGTFVQTGVGLIHSINERIAATLESQGRKMPRPARPAVALVLLITAVFLANRFGLVALIANGYGILTFGFLAVFVVPVLCIGTYKILWPTAPGAKVDIQGP
ncbi:hypothetical protein [Paremcibacter congregatus]|uniref:Membrane protein YkvI n=1 Tax=Paremcibacter congregatus TaxID=2043170 RepID=A0A2G4YYT0_9PROT|nr:hypothetical protein [Paremcibacter congregatus]PHZ86606.1 hypothetical protein CRD36_01630 [Paremcibacter congregatus]QDE26408.1 hypothetical protein FIV45_03505 [Paremcibacter congregatus]